MDIEENSAVCKGQVATETLVLVGFAVAFMVPIALLFLSSSNSQLGQSSALQAKAAARFIADSAGELYLQGKSATTSVVVNYPPGIYNGSVENGLVSLSIDAEGRKLDVGSFTFANVSGNLSGKRGAGLQSIRMAYVKDGNFVNISYG